jgi:hypothetical protein
MPAVSTAAPRTIVCLFQIDFMSSPKKKTVYRLKNSVTRNTLPAYRESLAASIVVGAAKQLRSPCILT